MQFQIIIIVFYSNSIHYELKFELDTLLLLLLFIF